MMINVAIPTLDVNKSVGAPLLLQGDNAKRVATYFYLYYRYQAKIYSWKKYLRFDVMEQLKQIFGNLDLFIFEELEQEYNSAAFAPSQEQRNNYYCVGMVRPGLPLFSFIASCVNKDRDLFHFQSTMEKYLEAWESCDPSGREAMDSVVQRLLDALPK